MHLSDNGLTVVVPKLLSNKALFFKRTILKCVEYLYQFHIYLKHIYLLIFALDCKLQELNSLQILEAKFFVGQRRVGWVGHWPRKADECQMGYLLPWLQWWKTDGDTQTGKL